MLIEDGGPTLKQHWVDGDDNGNSEYRRWKCQIVNDFNLFTETLQSN